MSLCLTSGRSLAADVIPCLHVIPFALPIVQGLPVLRVLRVLPALQALQALQGQPDLPDRKALKVPKARLAPARSATTWYM